MLYILILALSVCCGLLSWNQYRFFKRIESFRRIVEALQRIVEALRLEKSLDKSVKASESVSSCLDKMKIDHLIELEQRIVSLEQYILKSLQNE